MKIAVFGCLVPVLFLIMLSRRKTPQHVSPGHNIGRHLGNLETLKHDKLPRKDVELSLDGNGHFFHLCRSFSSSSCVRIMFTSNLLGALLLDVVIATHH
jgi:hypothetical protein